MEQLLAEAIAQELDLSFELLRSLPGGLIPVRSVVLTAQVGPDSVSRAGKDAPGVAPAPPEPAGPNPETGTGDPSGRNHQVSIAFDLADTHSVAIGTLRVESEFREDVPAPGGTAALSSVGQETARRLSLLLGADALRAEYQQLQDTALRLTTALDQSTDLICDIAPDGRVIRINATVTRLLDYAPDQLIGHQTEDFLAPDARSTFQQILTQMTNGEPVERIRLPVMTRSGDLIWLEWTGVFLTRWNILRCTGRDVTRQQQTQGLVTAQANLLEGILHGRPVTETLEQVALLAESLDPGLVCVILLLDEDTQKLKLGAAPSLPQTHPWGTGLFPIGPKAGPCGRSAYHRKDILVPDIADDPLWAAGRKQAAGLGLKTCWSNPILTEQGKLLGAVTFFWRGAVKPDQHHRELVRECTFLSGIAIERYMRESAQKFHEEELAHVAFHDSLTGLPNRVLLLERLEQTLVRAQRHEHGVVVLFIDLDGFKPVNDEWGHDNGDLLLTLVAQRLVSCMRNDQTVARYGGDEFVCLLEGPCRSDWVERVAKTVVESLSAPYALPAGMVSLTGSVGAVLTCGVNETPDSILRDADQAMYEAKRTAKGGYRIVLHESV